MEKISTLSTIRGRKVLIELFKFLRYEKQYSSIRCLFITWRICLNNGDLSKILKRDISIIHKLGFIAGTTLWLQEIVNRFYFSTINSFVYFGAAILLALIGIRRFSSYISDTIVILGVAFESLMLLLIFFIMLFTPNDEILENENNDENDLLIEIGEIGTDLVATVNKLENLILAIEQLIREQVNLTNITNQIAKNTADAVSPNTQMLDTMRATNSLLEEFKNNIEMLNKNINELKKEEIKNAVKQELENLLFRTLNSKIEKDEEK